MSQLAYRSSTVAAKTTVPMTLITPATMKGDCGASIQSNPPMLAAGVIVRLRTRSIQSDAARPQVRRGRVHDHRLARRLADLA